MQIIPSGIKKNCALVEEVACLRNEIDHGNEIRAMNDKLDKPMPQ